jgi:4-amino-4-deoxy-L-arabinose transferase-like glycosyltransferase
MRPRLAGAKGLFRRALVSPRFVPTCLVAALAARLCWVLAVQASPIDDFSWYYDRAVDLAAGRGLTDHGVPTAYWPVGYPLLLAGLFMLTGPSLLAAKLLNVALGVGIVWLSYRISRRLFVSEAAGRMTLLLMAFYPNQIAYTSLTASETPFLFLMLLGLLILLREKRSLVNDALAGIVFGMGCLTKPTMLFVPAVFFGIALMSRMRWTTVARGLVVYAALGLVILPWCVRNYQVFGRPVFIVTSGGINLLIGNNPAANGGYGDADPASAALVDAEKDEGAREIIASTIARRYMREHPWRTVELIPFRLWNLYAKDVEGFYWNELAGGAVEGAVTRRPMFLLKVFAELYYLSMLAMFAAGVCSFYLAGKPPFPHALQSALGLGLIAYFTLVMMLLFGSSRLHFPMVPCIAWYAGGWLASRVRAMEPQPQLAAPLINAWS